MIERADIYIVDGSAKPSGRFVRKVILRTGEWPVTPTRAGLVKRRLTVVRDGKSDASRGVIALDEIVRNFYAVGLRVQVPLAESADDHRNATRENTGWVRDLEIVDDEGGSRLVAKMEITEPDVREKILRGTYADVSCGIPFNFRSRGNTYGAVLEHVALTNRPFIDGLGPFALAASIRAEEHRTQRIRDALHGAPDATVLARTTSVRAALRGGTS